MDRPRKISKPRTELAQDAAQKPSDLATVFAQMTPARRRQFYWLLCLMVVGAVAELGTIGSVIPFLSILTDNVTLESYPWLDAGAQFGLGRAASAGIVFAALAILAGAIRLRMAWSIQNFSYLLGHEIMIEIERRLLFQPYSFHIEQHSSSLLASIEKVEVLIFDFILPTMQALVGSFLALFIIAGLIWIDPFTALIAAGASGALYAAVSAIARKRLAANSEATGRSFNERLKIAQESLGSIRDVLLDGTQGVHVALFRRVDLQLALARANTAFIATAPRFVIETAGLVMIAAVSLFIVRRVGGLDIALPLLGAIAYGAQRLLPLLQQMYNGWTTSAGYFSVISQIAELLRLPVDADSESARPLRPLPVKERISFESVSFTYPTRSRPALADISFDIPAGTAVAVVGETGSGKSTLADLLMGLLDPDEGQISVDGTALTRRNRRRWSASIAHVPQSIFLADTTIARNIALAVGEGEVDFERVVDSARKAQLHDFIELLPDGYDTVVGERGVRLSGGQRQRLGLARAIYKNTPVLLLDEATSALDEATEQAIFDSLEALRKEGRTMVIIAHRPSTISRCDRFVRIHEGRIVDSGLTVART